MHLGLESNKEVAKLSPMTKVAELVLGLSFPLSSFILIKREKDYEKTEWIEFLGGIEPLEFFFLPLLYVSIQGGSKNLLKIKIACKKGT